MITITSKKGFLLLTTLLFGLSTLFAGEMTLDDLLSRIDAAEKNISGVQFEFTQEIVYSLTKEKQSNSGEVIYLKPNNIYMKQRNPLEQTIVSNGKKVWIYTPAYQQVLVDDWKKWTKNSQVPASLLDFKVHLTDMKKKYSFSYEGIENNRYILLLTPRVRDAWRLKLWVGTENLLPERTELQGENITVTTETKNYKLNPEINPKIFSFKTPKGVEVLNIP